MSDLLITILIIILLALFLAGQPEQRPTIVYIEQPANDTLSVNQAPVMQALPTLAHSDSGLLPGNTPPLARDCPFVLSRERLQKCLNGQEY